MPLNIGLGTDSGKLQPYSEVLIIVLSNENPAESWSGLVPVDWGAQPIFRNGPGLNTGIPSPCGLHPLQIFLLASILDFNFCVCVCVCAYVFTHAYIHIPQSQKQAGRVNSLYHVVPENRTGLEASPL